MKRPGWSDEGCHQRGASAEGNDALSQAAAIAGPDGERVLIDILSREFSAEFPSAKVQRVIEGSLRMPRAAAAELMLSTMQSDFRDVLPRITRPTLCIGGQQSHLNPKTMPWIASRIPGAQLSMIDARHFVQLEKPEPFNSVVHSFVKTIES